MDKGQSLSTLPARDRRLRKLTLPGPIHSAFNNPENLLYVPQGQFGYFGVGVYDYPSLALVTTIPIEDYPGGAALSPAPMP